VILLAGDDIESTIIVAVRAGTRWKLCNWCHIYLHDVIHTGEQFRVNRSKTLESIDTITTQTLSLREKWGPYMEVAVVTAELFLVSSTYSQLLSTAYSRWRHFYSHSISVFRALEVCNENALNTRVVR